jgi:xanthine dehydrogenase YagS FAD-binding subunit
VKRFSWIEPDDLNGALAAGALPGALYKAGGVDLADRLKEHLDEPEALVNLRRVGELDFLKHEEGALSIGPLVTLHRLSTDAAVLKGARALAEAAGHAATPQIRHMATLGGNLAQRPRCWYFRSELFNCRKKGGDTCFALAGEHEHHAVFDNDLCAAVHPSATAAALVALGAQVKLRSAKGERTLPIEELFVRPATDVRRETQLEHGELIAEVRVPGGRRSAYSKLMQKQSFDWPLAEVAVALSLDGTKVRDARIVLGAAAPTPHRARSAEKWLIGRALEPSAIHDAGRLALAGATPLERNSYKLPLFEAMVRRTIEAAAKEEP